MTNDRTKYPNAHAHLHARARKHQNFQVNWIRRLRGLAGTSFLYGNSKSETAVTLSKNYGTNSSVQTYFSAFVQLKVGVVGWCDGAG